MKYTKKKGDTSTLRKIWNDDKTKLLGVVGTVGDLLAAGILEKCEEPAERWLCIRMDRMFDGEFGDSRDEAVQAAFGGEVSA